MGTDSGSARSLTLGAALVALLAVGFWLFYKPAPPSLGGDEEVWRVTDALFTAVTSRSESRLAHCETQFADLRARGRLPEPADRRLTALVTKARGGAWDSAARELYDFIAGQRR